MSLLSSLSPTVSPLPLAGAFSYRAALFFLFWQNESVFPRQPDMFNGLLLLVGRHLRDLSACSPLF